MYRCLVNLTLQLSFLVGYGYNLSATRSAEPTRQTAVEALTRAVEFFRDHCSAGGGYIFRLSADLSLREGETAVGPTTAWIEPPATPAVGLAYLRAYQLTREPILLAAARDTASALLHGQLQSGGWTEQIEFAPQDRRRYAYRVEGPKVDGQRNTTTFDDDKTQSAIRFLMQLDQELDESDPRVHEAVQYALDAVLQAQYTNGAWPQKFDGQAQAAVASDLPADYPVAWSREFPNQKYTDYYTLNDGTLCDLIDTLLLAGRRYGDQRYTEAAQRGGEFLLRAQMPAPQAGWAQQYDRDMHPAWARKFEPPALSGGESQAVMQLLLRLYESTADERYLRAVERGLAYYQTCILSSGRLARFYELHTNRPLYFTKTYELTYADDDIPTHYAFTVTSGLERLERDLKKLRDRPTDQLEVRDDDQQPRPSRLTAELRQSAALAINSLDARGAWVEPGRLRTYADSPVEQVISSGTFIKNLEILAQFVAASVP